MNEPEPNSQDRGAIAHFMRLFAGAVHAGDASAQAIGPAFVDLTWTDTRGWYAFFNAGGHTYCDAISFHAYNAQTNGDLNLGRASFDAFSDLMQDFSVSLPLWQTESTHSFTPVYGVYHPRRARIPLLQTLQQEQYGVPKEQNNYWYEVSHGFNDYPAWIVNGDGSLNPQAVLYRVLAEETWGKVFSSALDFGDLGNAIFVGNVYSGASGKTVALMATSYIPGAAVELTIADVPGPVTVVDGFGNETTVALADGVVRVPLTDVPSYVELASGASVSVHRCLNWSPLGTGPQLQASASSKQIDGVTYAVIADEGYLSDYANQTGAAPTAGAEPPSTVTLTWASAQLVERVLVWCEAWQSSGTLVKFTVEAYESGQWLEHGHVSKPSPPWFYHGTSSTNAGCFVETFWDEQWIFDVRLDHPTLCTGIRLQVTEASFGGEPVSSASFGQGRANQAFKIQEVAVVDSQRYAALGV